MTAINVSATIAQYPTATGPSVIKIITVPVGTVPYTCDLGVNPSDGKQWYVVKGMNATSGTAIRAIVSGTTLTVPIQSCISTTDIETLILHLVRA